MITGNIIQRVFYVKYEKYSGTAFTIEYNNRQYLISTTHTFPYITNGQDILFNIFHKNQWYDSESKIYIHKNKEVDICVISLERDISPRSPIYLTKENLVYGMNVYFLGFPYGKMMQAPDELNNGFPMPFIKKATLSTLMINRGELELFYLDGINNPGFSGGPCVMRNSKNEIVVFGVIKGYLPNTIIFNSPLGPINYEENSGIIEVHSIKHLHEILQDIE